MSTERMNERVAACYCGKGDVIAHYWANDHAFASDYSWHLSKFDLQCADCEHKWKIVPEVANPITDSPEKVAYFVEREESQAVDKHNSDVEQKIHQLGKEIQRLQATLDTTIRDLKNTLVSRAEGAEPGLKAKFYAVGKLLGFPDLSSFRERVGQTRPSTYVAQLVTVQSCIDVLSRLGRDDEVGHVTDTIAKIDDLKNTLDALKASKCLPRAAGHFLYNP